ncbi:ABC transporter substrate-binding protein [Arthrobacter sp. A2-55]|uniref:ABC transporter substrate-binding protein n=1 Tax=Arthrobacter sp. A2-55 TaxID=2897337 RepID=UPI0021CD6C6E|nr:ABC transporter substrate-binding protein [Arthrobacter sp. A2-55]MCU6480273.1 ABC transporter substrate-binding protein [Arthrobacter sp. A2-55]
MKDFGRRNFLGAIIAGSALTMVGCKGAVAGGQAGDGILTLGADAGASNQFPENFNANGGGDGGPGIGFFYETLFRVSTRDGGKLEPALAEKVVYSNAGATATYTLRKGVTWSDGKPFTADDVAYTYNFVFGAPAPDGFIKEPVKALDAHTVEVNYNSPNYQQDTNMSMYYPVYPKHIYEKQGAHDKFVDKKPVGTGPGVLKSFSGQQVQITLREDYWGGKAKGVKEVHIIPTGTVGNIQSSISSGKVDWADGGGAGVLTQFLGMGKDNHYEYFPDGSSRGVLFGCTFPPFTDAAVRRAFRDSVDLTAATKAVGIGYTVPSVTGLNLDLYKSYLLPEYAKPLEPNVDKAKADLAAAGWTVEGGNLTKDGKSYPVRLFVNLGQATDIVVAPMIIDQWKKNLGIDVKYMPTPDTVFQAKIHDYEMMVWTANLNGSPYNAFQGYSWKNLEAGPQKLGYGNQGLWKMPKEANDALAALQALPMQNIAEITTQLQIIQKAVAEGAPYLSYMSGGSGEMWTTKNWKGFPSMKDEAVNYRSSIGGYNNAAITTINLEKA